MVLRDFTAESRPFPEPTLAALVPPYYPGATHFLPAMTSKEAECAPIQMEPVDLSVNKKSSNPSSPSMSPRSLSLPFPSPASSPPSSSCIDLRLHSSRHLLPSGPGDDTSNSADEHSPLPLDIIHRTGSAAYLSLQRIKQASLFFINKIEPFQKELKHYKEMVYSHCMVSKMSSKNRGLT